MFRFHRGCLCVAVCLAYLLTGVEGAAFARPVEDSHAVMEEGHNQRLQTVDTRSLLEAPFLLARFSSPQGKKYEIKLLKQGDSFAPSAASPGMWESAGRNALGAVLAVVLLMAFKDLLQHHTESRNKAVRRRAIASLRRERVALLAALKEGASVLLGKNKEAQAKAANVCAATAARLEERAFALRDILPETVGAADALREGLLRRCAPSGVRDFAASDSQRGGSKRRDETILLTPEEALTSGKIEAGKQRMLTLPKENGKADTGEGALIFQREILEGSLGGLLRENPDLQVPDALLIGQALTRSKTSVT